MKCATVLPAYGRDYNNQKTLKADWKGGKDFKLCYLTHDVYFSIRDVAGLIADGFTHLQFRYKQKTQIMMLKLA